LTLLLLLLLLLRVCCRAWFLPWGLHELMLYLFELLVHGCVQRCCFELLLELVQLLREGLHFFFELLELCFEFLELGIVQLLLPLFQLLIYMVSREAGALLLNRDDFMCWSWWIRGCCC
jgi:hypothetical protein